MEGSGGLYIHGVAKSQTQLKRFSTCAHISSVVIQVWSKSKRLHL